jgi:formate C-acetyltransferase
MGLATVADSLAAVKKLVFEEGLINYNELMEALDANFEGCEPLKQMLLNRAPKYGNDDPYVDDIAVWIVDYLADEMLRQRVSTGGRYVSAMASNVSNIYAGKEVGATPDGREAWTPLSDAASPYYGRDINGPTAFLRSVARPDYHKVLTGSVVNMKFNPEHFQGEEGAARFSAITHWFVSERIHELQFNFTGNAVLKDALDHPEGYAGLVVRVSGFSAYFTRLAPEVQQDILRRRAHL